MEITGTHFLFLALGVALGFLLRGSGPQQHGFGSPPTPTPAEKDASVPEEKTPMVFRIFGILFLSVWLIGWTFGILSAAVALSQAEGGEGSLFLVVWLIGASLGWVFAVYALIQLIRGRSLKIWQRGR